MMIYVIIPVFNRKEFTRKCLQSLREQTFSEFKTIVVDDGSTDGTKEMLKNEFPEVLVRNGDGNLWWTASINLGIEIAIKSDASAILTLNNDTIASPDFLQNLNSSAKQHPEALIGAFAVDYKSKKPIYGGGNFRWRSASIKLWLDHLKEDEYQGLYPVDHFPGRGLLIPVVVFKKIGLFNQKKLPHYFADYDFTHQAFKNGFKIFCDFDSKLYIFPDESGDKENRKKKTLSNYFNHLFGMKGGGNLKNFTIFAFRNCPYSYLPFFLITGYLKRVLGYLLK